MKEQETIQAEFNQVYQQKLAAEQQLASINMRMEQLKGGAERVGKLIAELQAQDAATGGDKDALEQ